MVLEINTSSISPDSVYPDDALFVGFGQEDVFEDAEEISESLNISEEEAYILLSSWESTPDSQLAEEMKFLWGWYVIEHGEISTTQSIPPSSIVDMKPYR